MSIMAYIGCLIGCVYIYKYYKQRSTLIEIQRYLSKENEEVSGHYIKLATEDKTTQAMLSELNQLLSTHRENLSKNQELEHTTKQMIANFSHDTKTPLTVIHGYLEMALLNNQIEKDQRQRLERAYEKTKELLTLMNRFFELAKLESQDVSIELESFDLCSFPKGIIVEFYPSIQKKGLEVQVAIPDKAIAIYSNKEMIQRIVNNLVTNAIAHGFEGGVLGVVIRDFDREIEIVIWDKGKGIDRAYQDNVFNRLFTLEDSRNRNYQGSGLGLSITKQLVTLLKGQIELESRPYEETSFTVRLPKD